MQSGLALADKALESEDYHAAWESLRAEPNELARWRGRAEVLYRAGDPAGALGAARAGLAIDSGQIELIYRATGAAIWLEDGAAAVGYADRLARAANALGKSNPEKSQAWQEIARDYGARSQAIVLRDRALDRTLACFRALSIGGFASWSVLVLWVVLRGQGRSSKPVS